MRKTAYITVLSIFLILAGCGTEKTPDSGGTWTFKSVAYKGAYANVTRWSFLAYTGDNMPSSNIQFNFKDKIYPNSGLPKEGTYLLTRDMTPSDSFHVYVVFSDTSATRFYSPSPNSQGSITITRSGSTTDNRVTITIPPVMLISNKNSADSALLEGTIIQTP